MYKVPILFVIFNRPEIAAKSFLKIKEIAPQKLYIAQDGARNNVLDESKIVLETRERIMNMIDWPCDVKTLFQEQNLGCGRGVCTAISWLFNSEERGIILEDDCVVDLSFFKFMEEMLELYKDDQRIGMVAGSNLISSYRESRSSYFFSRYKSCWGWGTWRRSWINIDMDMKWRNDYLMDIINNSGYYAKGTSKWLHQLKCIDEDYVSAWDWQWYFSLAAQNQLCVYPSVNLVSNIGNDKNATHTSFGSITVKSQELKFPLTPPLYICPNERFDKAFWRDENKTLSRILRLIPNGLKSRAKDMLLRLR